MEVFKLKKNRTDKINKSGISLISLIITIIVIIILAAIVIFNGLNTPNSAQFAAFTQQVDNVQMAVMNKHGELKTKHSIAGHYRTDEQIYLEIATGEDHGMEAFMCTTGNTYKTTSDTSTGIQNILPGKSTDKEHSIGMTLPKVRESNNAWYVTKEGRVFNGNGYTYNGKTYYDARHYEDGEKGSTDDENSEKAVYVYAMILEGNDRKNSKTSIVMINDMEPSGPSNGDEVEVTLKEKKDNYYIVGEKDGKYLLLTKYSLTKEETNGEIVSVEQNPTYKGYIFCGGDYGYWYENGENYSSKYPLDLNTYQGETGGKDQVMQMVRFYGNERDVECRLMTLEEANNIGFTTRSGPDYLVPNISWWLGTANDQGIVSVIRGTVISDDPLRCYATINLHGVRPVIEISKQNVDIEG